MPSSKAGNKTSNHVGGGGTGGGGGGQGDGMTGSYVTLDGKRIGPLIKAGPMAKEGRILRSWTERFFLLTPDTLLYVSSWPASKSKGSLPLRQVNTISQATRKGRQWYRIVSVQCQ